MPAQTLGQEDITHLSYCEIKLNGSSAPAAVMEDLLECSVENSIHLPDMCSLRLRDTEFRWLDSSQFVAGVKLVVQAGAEKSSAPVIFTGEIAGMEMDLSGNGFVTLVIRAYDRSHRLHRGRQQRSFVQMKDSDIVQKVGSEAGFTVTADTTGQVHEWVMQNNETNWEFLQERAAYNGFRLYCVGENGLHFKKVKDGGDSVTQLEWGTNMRSFRPRVSASPQVAEVTVRGWDPKEKRAIIGKSAEPKGLADVSAKDGKKAASVFGPAKMVVVDRPIHSQGEADALACSLFDEINADYLEADGLCYGRPEIKPGIQVQVKNVGEKFSGKYFITASTHIYTPAEGLTTLFSATGKRPNTLLSLLDTGQNKTQNAKNGANIVVALVTDNKDPQNLGRVKVKYPWLAENDTSWWARIATPMAGPDRGFYFLPEIDDEVLVAFEQGDIRRPYLIGSLWNGKDKPVEPNDKAVKGGKVERRSIKTRIGHTLLFDDTDGKGEMSMTTKGKHIFILDDAKKKIEIKTTTGHTVTLDDDGKKIVIVDKTGSNKITIDSSANSMKLECMKDFTIEAGGKVTVKGQQGIELNTPMELKAEGGTGVSMHGLKVEVKADTMLDLEGSAQATLKGSAMVTIQGGLVNIN